MTPDRQEKPKTLNVPDAGRIYFGLGRKASYEAAARGEIPVIRFGKLMRCPVALLDKMVGDTPEAAA